MQSKIKCKKELIQNLVICFVLGDRSRKLEPTIYKDDEYENICAVRTICIYIGRLTPEQRQPSKPFLLNVNHAAVNNPGKQRNWFSSSPLGKNHIASLFKSTFEALGVDCKAEKIMATSARKNFMQGAAESGVPANWVSLAAGHQVEQSQLNYLEMKDKTDKAMSLCINRAVNGVKNNNAKDFRCVLNAAGEKKTGPETADKEMTEPKPGRHNLSASQGLQYSMQQPMAQNLHPHMQNGLFQQQMMPQPGPSFVQMNMSPPQMMPMLPQPMIPQPFMSQPMMPQPMMVTQQPAIVPMMMSPSHQPAMVYPQQQAMMSPQLSSYGFSPQPMLFNPNRQTMMDITNNPNGQAANHGNVSSGLKQICYEDKEN